LQFYIVMLSGCQTLGTFIFLYCKKHLHNKYHLIEIKALAMKTCLIPLLDHCAVILIWYVIVIYRQKDNDQTIEGELMKALHKVEVISQEAVDTPQVVSSPQLSSSC